MKNSFQGYFEHFSQERTPYSQHTIFCFSCLSIVNALKYGDMIFMDASFLSVGI